MTEALFTRMARVKCCLSIGFAVTQSSSAALDVFCPHPHVINHVTERRNRRPLAYYSLSLFEERKKDYGRLPARLYVGRAQRRYRSFSLIPLSLRLSGFTLVGTLSTESRPSA